MSNEIPHRKWVFTAFVVSLFLLVIFFVVLIIVVLNFSTPKSTFLSMVLVDEMKVQNSTLSANILISLSVDNSNGYSIYASQVTVDGYPSEQYSSSSDRFLQGKLQKLELESKKSTLVSLPATIEFNFEKSSHSTEYAKQMFQKCTSTSLDKKLSLFSRVGIVPFDWIGIKFFVSLNSKFDCFFAFDLFPQALQLSIKNLIKN